MKDNPAKNFIAAHLMLLASISVLRFVPDLAGITGDLFLPPQQRFVRFYLIGLISVIFICYAVFLYFYKKSGINLLKPGTVQVYFWVSTTAVLLFLCAQHAVLSSDLYEYSIRGRMFGVYGINPYLNTPAIIKGDMFYPLIFWKNTPECYGPAWVLIGAAHTLFFKGSLFLTMFFHKAILLLFLATSGYFFYKLCGEAGIKRPEIHTAAFVFNPLVLIMTVVDGHNEIAMVAFMLAAFYMLYRGKYAVSLLMFALAVQVKFVYLLAAPFVGLYILLGPGDKNMRSRVLEIIAGCGLGAVAVFLLWQPFGISSVGAIIDYYRDLGGLFWPDSIPYVLFVIADKLGLPLSEQLTSRIFSAMFLLIYGYAVYYFVARIKRDKRAIFSTLCVVFLGLIFTNYSPFQAWYLLWALPFVLLSGFRGRYLMAIFLSYFLIMTFWKRMSVLAIPMVIGYVCVLASPRIKEKFFKELDLDQ